MWSPPGGHAGPPTHPSLFGDLRRSGPSGTLAMSLRASTQILGPLYFDPIGISRETNIRRPSLVSPLLEFQPLIQMPLEPQIADQTRTYRRIQYDNRRGSHNDSNNEPYNDNEPGLPQPEDETSQLFDEEVQSHDAEIHIDHWARDYRQNNENQFSYQWSETFTLESGFYLQSHIESSVSDESQSVSLNSSSFADSSMSTISSEAIDLSFDRNFNVPVLVSRASFPNPIDSISESPCVASDCPTFTVSSTTDCHINTMNVRSPDHSYSPKTSDSNTEENLSFSDVDLDEDHQHDTNAHCESMSSERTSTESEHNLASETFIPIRTLSIPLMPQPSALARHVANRVIKHARDIRYPNEREMWCLNCGLFPLLPVTGQCGHTRCFKCIEVNGTCPCGVQAPEYLHVNILIQDLIEKILPNDPPLRTVLAASSSVQIDEETYLPPSISTPVKQREWRGPERHRRNGRSLYFSPMTEKNGSTTPRRKSISVQARFKYAQELLALRRFREAAAHLAHVAASSEPTARMARTLLAQTVVTLSETRDPRRITRELYRAVRLNAGTSWLKESDLECILCYHTFTQPVTTPCGHTYCRICIEKSLDYRKTCALCLRPLAHFNLAATRDTTFVCAALASISALNLPSPPDPNVIPIFACTAAYPTIPCPLFIFDPRYWLMIRRVLESGSRKFGMVAYERDRTYSDYGTILEVRDCVQFEDGRSILSTVGVSRFRVIERDVRDGCDVARIEPLTDITPTEEIVILELRLLVHQISDKALLWLSRLNNSVLSDIETAFGQMPRFDQDADEWWETPNGPDWLWWLIAILPLRSEIQVLMLSTKQLVKRMMAVSRTLEAVCDLKHFVINNGNWLQSTP